MLNEEYKSHEKIVRSFLDAMESRSLNVAHNYVSEDFKMLFPGGKIFFKTEEMIEWGKTRYKWIKKSYDIFVSAKHKDRNIVFCNGMLFGEWLNGLEFNNIRFIDKFTFDNNKICIQEVWNDLGEVKR